MSNEFFSKIVSSMKDKDTVIVSNIPDTLMSERFVDTGSYVLNALFSTSIYGGVSSSKVTAFAGIESVGKTFFVLGIVRTFLKANKNAGVIFYDSEGGTTKELIKSRGIDASRVVLVKKYTVQDFKTHSLNVLESYLKTPKDKRPPMMMILDSLGQLSTSKELKDSIEGKEIKDMTRPKVIKGAFRTLQGKLESAGVPMLVTNHVYAVIGSFVKMNEMGGGGALKYTASQIIYLSKKQDKEGNEVVGNIIKAKMQKSRISREKTVVETRISYDGGLDKYYGLIPFALEVGVFESVAGKYRIMVGPEAINKSSEKKGKKKKEEEKLVDESEIYGNPKKYFTKEVLDLIELYAKKHFSYGVMMADEENTIMVDENNE